MPGPWEAQKREVLETAQELARLGLVGGASGNVSLRLSGSEPLVAITPSQRPYRRMWAEDVLVIDFQGSVVEGELPVSSEVHLHLGTYRTREDVGAVIHSHSIYASVCSVAGLEVPPVFDELVVLVGGAIQVAEYAFPGTEELATKACAALGDRNAVLLRNHGLMAVGRDLEQALDVCQIVERAAQVYVLARLLGKASTLPPDVVEREKKLFEMLRRVEEG